MLVVSQDRDLKLFGLLNDCLSSFDSKAISKLLSFETVKNQTNLAISSWKNNNDKQCKTSMLFVSAVLSRSKLNFVEIRTYLPILSTLASVLVWNENLCSRIDLCWLDLKTPVLYSQFSSMCCNLTQSCSMNDLLEECIPLLSKESSNLLGIILVLNEILKSISTQKNSNLSDLELGHISSIYISILDAESTEVSIQQMSGEIPNRRSLWNTRKAFLLYGIGQMISINQKIVLPLTLYSLLENASNEDALVCEAAKSTLYDIAGCETGVPEFLNRNADLILSELSVRVTNLGLHPKSPGALLSLGEHLDLSKGAYGSFIDQVFNQSCDILAGGNVSQLVYSQIFYAFIVSISKHHRSTGTENDNNCSLDGGYNFKKTVLQKILEYQSSLGVMVPGFNDKESELLPEYDNGENLENEKKEGEEDEDILSPELSLASKISYRALNFLPNQDRSVKLTAMDTLTIGVKLLKDHQNQLLPLVHTIWQNIVSRCVR